MDNLKLSRGTIFLLGLLAATFHVRNADDDCLSSDLRDNFFKQIRDEQQLHLGACSNGNGTCDWTYRYRSYDGSCNNPDHPTWGINEDCFLRLLPALYQGYSDLTTSASGDPLPQPRSVSVNLSPDVDCPSRRLSHFFTIFGQGVAHDISFGTPALRSDVKCCLSNQTAGKDRCIPLMISTQDPYYSQFNFTCEDFERTKPCQQCPTSLGKKNIPNAVTGMLDCHHPYGTTAEVADKLRTKIGGRLRIQSPGHLLPKNDNMEQLFCFPQQYKRCFFTGDVRVNQHSYLMSVHTMLLREHNRLAIRLAKLNPHWDDERIYQEARKILGGEWQAIIYGSYLPLLLGRTLMADFELLVGTCTRWDQTIRLGAILESATCGFRAHSMVQHQTGFRGQNFSSLYFNNQLLHEGQLSNLIVGSKNVASQKFDKFFVADMSEELLRIPTDGYGFDIVTIDLARGRDHGLPSYVVAVEYCHGLRVNSFDDLTPLMPQGNINRLRISYKDVQDVDLYAGMLLEFHSIVDSVLTPTSACFSVRQFYTVKFGDRFYFEHVNLPNSFTNSQIDVLRMTSLARLLCENAKLKEIQLDPFQIEGLGNPTVKCSLFPKMDLMPWKEDPSTLTTPR